MEIVRGIVKHGSQSALVGGRTIPSLKALPAAASISAMAIALISSRTAPEQDKNLGIKTYLNGILVSNIVLDTSAATTDTIDYVATDQTGLTSASTRTGYHRLPLP
jgi:hypothetical protein